MNFEGSSLSVAAKLKTKEYWQGHDLSTNHLACCAWLQHAIRLKELGHAAIKAFVDGQNPQDSFMVQWQNYNAMNINITYAPSDCGRN